MRTRPRRPILNALKNPCSCSSTPQENPRGAAAGGGHTSGGGFSPNPPRGGGGGGGHGGGRIGWGGRGWWGGWGYPYWGGWGYPFSYGVPYSYAYAQQDVWLPATKGQAPVGQAVWVLWNGGSTGTKVRAGSAISEQVQILETAKGGPTGTLVRTAPLQTFAPGYAPVYAPYVYPTTIVARRF